MMTINKFQLDTIYWQLLELRGLTKKARLDALVLLSRRPASWTKAVGAEVVDDLDAKLGSIDDSMAAINKELGQSTHTDEYIKGIS